MKIKSYPGRAVEANLPLDKHNSMGLLYEANWMNANERIKQQAPPTSFSKSNVNISSLSKYQDQLEQIKAYEIEQQIGSTRVVAQFNGYKPTTLKSRKSFKEYNDWDGNEPKPVHNPLYNHAQNNWHSTDYLINTNNNNINNKRTDPKLRRSQTVIVKQPLSKTSESFYESGVQGEIDLKDFYFRRNQLRQLEEKHQSNYPKNFSVHQHSASNCIDNNGIQRNCDSVSDNKDSLYRDCSNNLSALNRNNNDTVNNSSTNRMNCYKASNFYAQNKSSVIGEESESELNGKANTKVLLNPLARNKSIKINHFDMVTTAKEPQKLKPEEIDGKLCDTNGKSGKKVKKNSFSRMFYNTISAGSKFPRVFLGRSGKNQRAKLNLAELSEAAESQQSNSSESTLSSMSPNISSSSLISNFNKNQSTYNRKHGSATSSDSDSFVIPRPRLIVPVHSYRKRRTGNLTSDQTIINSKNANCDRDVAAERGK